MYEGRLGGSGSISQVGYLPFAAYASSVSLAAEGCILQNP